MGALESNSRSETVDWEPIKAKFAEVRERHCTARVIAQPLAVSFGDPPTHDPAKTRVVDVRASRPNRALVVTMERFSDEPPLEQRLEHRLELVDNQWRLNSRVVKELGEPAIRGLL